MLKNKLSLVALLGLTFLAGCNPKEKELRDLPTSSYEIIGICDEAKIIFKNNFKDNSLDSITLIRTGVNPSGSFTNSLTYVPTNSEYAVLRDIFDKLH